MKGVRSHGAKSWKPGTAPFGKRVTLCHRVWGCTWILHIKCSPRDYVGLQSFDKCFFVYDSAYDRTNHNTHTYARFSTHAQVFGERNRQTTLLTCVSSLPVSLSPFPTPPPPSPP